MDNPTVPMHPFLAALRHRPLLADGALGSYLFALTGRVSEQNHLYEAFNLARPASICAICVHLADHLVN